MSDDDVCEHQYANYLRMMSERDALRTEVERLREDYQAACEARMTFHDELDAVQRQVADLRAGIEAAVVTMNREAYRQPTPWVDRLANRLCALLAESGEQPGDEGVTVEWGVGYGDRHVATPSREEAEEWIADDDAWNPGEERWLVMRQVGPWTHAANARNVERLEKALATLKGGGRR